jgi:hypothetical protein
MKIKFPYPRFPSTALLFCGLLLRVALAQAGPLKTFVAWDAHAPSPEQNDQRGFFAVLESMGFHPAQISLEDLTSTPMAADVFIAVPAASAKRLTPAQADRLLSAVAQGARLMTDGESAVLARLRLGLSDPARVDRVRYLLEKTEDVEWSSAQTVSTLRISSATNVKTIYSTLDGRPLVVVGAFGRGMFMAMGPLLDPMDGRGYARFPNVVNAVLSEMGMVPAFRRQGLDAYLDMADRYRSDYGTLAKQWRASGIRTIYASAWYFDDDNYRYDDLIQAAHRNGILVYAWFQWPHVSEKFWNDHPQWREKTATLEDAHVDWRLLMNFQDPDCLKATLAGANAFLRAHDWDGVNMAEFYFESFAGPASPAIYTPMNPAARREFKARSGFDPLDLFVSTSAHYWKRNARALSSYVRYRDQTMDRLYDAFIANINAAARAKKIHWPVVITTIDVLTHPELDENYGIDMAHVARVLKSNNATLQLEDEFFDWKLGPDRYTRLGQRYREAFAGVRFMLDVNVVSEGVDPGTRFPTLEPTGAELVQIFHAAERASAGVAFYSEYSVRPGDWPLMPYAMAADLKAVWGESNVAVSAPFTVSLLRPVDQARVDGAAWGCGDDHTVLLPAGRHWVQFDAAPVTPVSPRMTAISGELTGCRQTGRSLRVAYTSAARCLILVADKPAKIKLDGRRAALRTEPANSQYVVYAPAGKHAVEFW